MPRKESNSCGELIGFSIVGFIIWGIVQASGCLSCSEESTPKVMSQEELIKQGFDFWDGSHIALKELVKRNIKDRESFKHISTSYQKMDGPYLRVKMIYSGTNSFGGTSRAWVDARTSIESGDVIEIIDRGHE